MIDPYAIRIYYTGSTTVTTTSTTWTASPNQHAITTVDPNVGFYRGRAVVRAPDPPPTPMPTDAAIVAEFEQAQRAERYGMSLSQDGHTVMRVGGYMLSMGEVRAAWSRELQRRRADACERERTRVRVQIDDPDEA